MNLTLSDIQEALVTYLEQRGQLIEWPVEIYHETEDSSAPFEGELVVRPLDELAEVEDY